MEWKRRLLSAVGQKKLQLFNRLAERPHSLTTADEIDRAFAALPGEGPYRITYVMNHVRINGGSKILLEHANHLVERGHDVTIVCHEPRPDWIEIKARYIEVPWQMTHAQAAPESDVIVCSVYDQIAEFYAYKAAPMLLFEQGDSYIYELEKQSANMQAHFKQAWSLPVPVLAVSSGLAEQLHQNFSRTPQVLHNALDERFFYKREAGAVSPNQVPRILFVGAEQTAFKGINDIKAALQIVRDSGRPVEAVWVTQRQPLSPFDGELHVSPEQFVLGDVYRSCDIYVSGSLYESFPLPPLEAMACGCAVVSTNNKGVLEYAQDGENCLLGEIGKPESLAAHLIDLIDHPEKRERLVEGGYRTAAKFSWPAIMQHLEGYLRGAMQIWRPVEAAAADVLLHVEVLPAGLTWEAAKRYIGEKNASIEGWCLWLTEGETVTPSGMAQMRRVLAEPFAPAYRLPVSYEDDIPGHQLVRWETRLVRGGQVIDLAEAAGECLPVRIAGGGRASAFLPAWLGSVRERYRTGQFDQVVAEVHRDFPTVSEQERPVAIKWLVLGLIEQGRFAEAFQVMLESLQAWPLNSDLLYLCAKVAGDLNRPEEGHGLLQLAILIGDALDLPESFADIRELANRLG